MRQGNTPERVCPGTANVIFIGVMTVLCCPGKLSVGFGYRDDLWGGAFVSFVAFAELVGKIALFVPDADENVDGHGDGEEEMSDGHHRGGPEGDEESEVEGMADQFIKERGTKAEIIGAFIGKVLIRLQQSEEMEVIDQECAEQDDRPTEERDGHQRCSGGATEGPDGIGQWLPEEEEDDEHRAGEQDIGAAFDGLGDEAGPSFFESLSCHDAVLDAEEGDEEQVDQDTETGGHGLRRGVIDGPGDDQVGEETDEI